MTVSFRSLYAGLIYHEIEARQFAPLLAVHGAALLSVLVLSTSIRCAVVFAFLVVTFAVPAFLGPFGEFTLKELIVVLLFWAAHVGGVLPIGTVVDWLWWQLRRRVVPAPKPAFALAVDERRPPPPRHHHPADGPDDQRTRRRGLLGRSGAFAGVAVILASLWVANVTLPRIAADVRSDDEVKWREARIICVLLARSIAEARQNGTLTADEGGPIRRLSDPSVVQQFLADIDDATWPGLTNFAPDDFVLHPTGSGYLAFEIVVTGSQPHSPPGTRRFDVTSRW